MSDVSMEQVIEETADCPHCACTMTFKLTVGLIAAMVAGEANNSTELECPSCGRWVTAEFVWYVCT